MEIRGIVTTTVLILALIAVSTTTAAAINCDCGDICVNETGWWNGCGAFNANTTPIQAAVDNANSGDTICVAAGNYRENVDIGTPHLTLAGTGAVTVTAENSDDHVFYVTADYVNISGFTATGATDWYPAGILLSGADHCNISENNCSNNIVGIYLKSSSNYNALTSNTASNNLFGIVLEPSSNNTLTGNTASNNGIGIGLDSSSNYNTLVSNNASSNSEYGIVLESSSSNLIYNNYWSNTNNARDDGTNTWNITKTAGTNIIGGPFLGGNYWNNYAGNDTNWDGLGDTMLPYNSSGDIQSGGDYHPLVVPFGDSNPPDPVNLANTTGGSYPYYWVNYTWSAGTGNITDSYNVLLNGTWTNGTEATSFMNVSMSPCDWVNITVFAYNASCTGTLSEGSVSDEVQACDVTPPVINITTPEPYGLYTVGMTLSFSATDDGSGIATIVGNLTNTSDVSQNVVGNNTVAPPVGVYDLVVTATDNAGNINVSDPVLFVVYDPDGGHAKGSGWIYPDNESTLPDGRAKFGFTAKYKDSNSTGKMSFQYKDADIKFKSKTINWLTISAVSAQFQGTGTINGDGLYTFRVQAKDNGDPGADVDHFDIKIWNGTDTEADPYHKAKNTIAGGDIEVHTN